MHLRPVRPRPALVAGAVLTAAALIASTLTATAAPVSDTVGNVHVLSARPHPTPGSPVDVLTNYETLGVVFEKDPSHWGGAYVDDAVLVVKYVGQSRVEAEAVLATQGIIRGVRLVLSDVSMADLEQAQKEADQALGADPNAVGWGPDYASSGLAVDLVGAEAGTLGTLEQNINARVPVDVVLGAAKGKTTSRYYDTIPYSGGNLIRLSGSTSAGYCSTGFNLTGSSDGFAYAVTAGHCYVAGSSGNRPTVSIMRAGGTSSGMGTIWTVSVGASGTTSTRRGDIGIYRYTPIAGMSNSSLGAGRVFVGNGNSTTNKPIIGTSDLPQNYQSAYIRTSGASGYDSGLSTGEISPNWISLVNYSHTYNDGFRIANVTVAEDASECVSPGDSGGAVYLMSGTSARAVGIISGSNEQGFGTTNCRNYYTPVKYIYFGGTIKTG